MVNMNNRMNIYLCSYAIAQMHSECLHCICEMAYLCGLPSEVQVDGMEKYCVFSVIMKMDSRKVFISMWLCRGTSMACRNVRYVCGIAYLCSVGLICYLRFGLTDFSDLLSVP